MQVPLVLREKRELRAIVAHHRVSKERPAERDKELDACLCLRVRERDTAAAVASCGGTPHAASLASIRNKPSGGATRRLHVLRSAASAAERAAEESVRGACSCRMPATVCLCQAPQIRWIRREAVCQRMRADSCASDGIGAPPVNAKNGGASERQRTQRDCGRERERRRRRRRRGGKARCSATFPALLSRAT